MSRVRYLHAQKLLENDEISHNVKPVRDYSRLEDIYMEVRITRHQALVQLCTALPRRLSLDWAARPPIRRLFCDSFSSSRDY